MKGEKMKNLNIEETRQANGGGRYYCKVCGKTSNSQWTIFSHIATRHIGAWTSNLYNLIVKVF